MLTTSTVPRGHFVDSMRTHSGERVVDGGTSLARIPPPEILRRMKEIDPSLVLEWRPLGKWRKEAEPGCWRLCQRGQSGAIRGMILWPPDMLDGRIIADLEAHWLPRLYDARNYRQQWMSDESDNAKLQAQRDATFAHVDHGRLRWEILRAQDAQGAGGSSAVHQVPAASLVTGTRAAAKEG